jgi:hypothetical protein
MLVIIASLKLGDGPLRTPAASLCEATVRLPNCGVLDMTVPFDTNGMLALG